jgi:hypothetical protein
MPATPPSTESTPSVRASPIELSAGPPLMTATLPWPPSCSLMNSPSWTPIASLSGPIQLVYSPVWNMRSTSTTGMSAAARAFSAAGADSSGPPEMMTPSTSWVIRSSTFEVSFAASPPASVLMISMFPSSAASALMASSMPTK